MIKKILKITAGLLIFVIAIGIYRSLPTKAQRLTSENNALGYVELLAQAKNSQPNPNMYASSQITPDNPLFDGVLAFQRGRYGLAEQKLKPLMEAGNLDAMFWYAETIMGASVLATAEAGDLLVKAAELGHPYAALRLDPDSYDCQQSLGNRCSQDWVKKGQAKLKQLAEQGDVKALYYANVRDKRGSAEDYQYNIDLVTQVVGQGYYAPLVEQLIRISHSKSLTIGKKQALVELLTLAANNNFVPAMAASYKYIKDKNPQKAEKLLLKLARLGNRMAINAIFHFDFQALQQGDESKFFNAYKFALVREIIFRKNNNAESMGWAIIRKEIRPFRDGEKDRIKLVADEFISQMTPVIYIDELHTEYNKHQ
ncbi:hypothetical protein [Shewanella surugensis]|uniref:Sel1 repeat family protein n=1 Tax=Shewanella surugensis TaxID=212020 RepID=A0ABT0LCU9_9GAMM|nr:hypothetical protein [Shewanella surugensis]MCL1125531.1 hypothetical protein [Shewanella surugensis]